MLKKFEYVREWYNSKLRVEFNADLAPQVREIIAKFEEFGIQEADPWTWKLLHDYLRWQQLGIKLVKQRSKIVEAILKYGKDSLVWEEIESTKARRKTDWIRVAYLCRVLVDNKDLLQGNLKRKGKLTIFMKQAIDYRRKLLIHPLTEKQRAYMWECERLVGLYYEDLSPEENGEVWRLEAEKYEKENKNG